MEDFKFKIKAKVDAGQISNFPNLYIIGVNSFTYENWINKIVYINTNYKGEYIFEPFFVYSKENAARLTIASNSSYTGIARFTLQNLLPSDIIIFYPEVDKK